MIRTTTIGETMVLIQFTQDDPEIIQQLLDALKSNFSHLTSINYAINKKRNDTFNDLEVVNYSGRDHVIEQTGDLRFIIGPKSFYQTNPVQAINCMTLLSISLD